jgi:hypothetical protein
VGFVQVASTDLAEPGTICTAERLERQRQESVIVDRRPEIKLDTVVHVKIKLISERHPLFLLASSGRRQKYHTHLDSKSVMRHFQAAAAWEKRHPGDSTLKIYLLGHLGQLTLDIEGPGKGYLVLWGQLQALCGNLYLQRQAFLTYTSNLYRQS